MTPHSRNPVPDPLRILMVTNHFFPSVGGLEFAARRLGTALTKKGIHVSVLTPRFKGLAKTELVGQVPVRRFFVLRSPHERYGFLSKLVYTLSLGVRLTRERHRYDLIHVHQALFAAVVCVAMAKLLRKKVIVKVAGSGENGNIRVLKTLFWGGERMFALLTKADAFISLSQEMKRELLEHGIAGDKIRSIPNGIDLADFSGGVEVDSVKRRLGLSESHFVGLFVGRLGSQKHVAKLIQSWKSVLEGDSSAMLVIAGDGPDRGRLTELAQRENLVRSVIFLGDVTNVRELLAVSDVFVLPSDSEGMSNALLEAQAAGVPCVASREDGNISMIAEGETGLLFNLADLEDIKAKIRFIKNNPAKAREFAAAAREQVARRFRIEIVADTYIALYRELLTPPALRPSGAPNNGA